MHSTKPFLLLLSIKAGGSAPACGCQAGAFTPAQGLLSNQLLMRGLVWIKGAGTLTQAPIHGN